MVKQWLIVLTLCGYVYPMNNQLGILHIVYSEVAGCKIYTAELKEAGYVVAAKNKQTKAVECSFHSQNKNNILGKEFYPRLKDGYKQQQSQQQSGNKDNKK